MGQTRKRHYDRYTLGYKLTAVRLANHPEVMSKTVAECLGLHPVMLYRWQMEYRRGELRENRHMKTKDDSPKRRRADPGQSKAEELTAAKRRIKQLEKALAQREEELELLKKAKQFFAKTKR
ncbi:transposase [Marinihelvus fidelis]|uniref:Transposase n=1 Tax=Marinihelvus fidelis TaxID=2613842 RepID=A0A5N0TD59_9GAMM|nr:transposase [Marinihelvus fidelis]KAA9131997.1 transposase [Marinihelvus fidelis]